MANGGGLILHKQFTKTPNCSKPKIAIQTAFALYGDPNRYCESGTSSTIININIKNERPYK
jgi:hypothetical protein